MFEIFSQEMDVTIVMVTLFVMSILCKLIPGIWYRHLIREVDNMAGTDSMLLKQCKLKFSNCYQLNGRVANIGIFVDKFISRLKVGPFSFDGVDHFSRQALVLSIFAGGIGVCRSLIKGRYFLEIVPFYLACFLAIYLYYMVAGMVNIKNLKLLLRVNLIDYLENHLSSRLLKTNRDLRELSEDEVSVRKKQVNVPLTQLSKKEPEPARETESVTKKEPEPARETESVTKKEPEPARETESVTKKELEPVRETESVTKKDPEPARETESVTKKEPEPVRETESVTKKEPEILKDSMNEISQKETKKKATAKRTARQTGTSDKPKADAKEVVKVDLKEEPEADLMANPKAEPITEQIPPRSIDPEEIRKVLQELLGYSQA